MHVLFQQNGVYTVMAQRLTPQRLTHFSRFLEILKKLNKTLFGLFGEVPKCGLFILKKFGPCVKKCGVVLKNADYFV